jgi:cytochrome c
MYFCACIQISSKMNNFIHNNFLQNFTKTMIKRLAFSVALITFGFSIKAQTIPADINALLQKNTCYTCHAANKKIIGPAWVEVAAKKYTKKQFVGLVAKPVPANWPGYPPMAALPNVPKGDIEKIYGWVSSLVAK